MILKSNKIMLAFLIVIGFIVGCISGYQKLQDSQQIIRHKSLLNYFLGR